MKLWMRKLRLFSSLGLLIISSCAVVGPDYERPEIQMPDEWTAAIDQDNKSKQTGAQRWWRKFNDPVLNELVTLSRTANPNIRIASARIAESWHQRSVLAGAWSPSSNFNSRVSEGLGTFDREGFDFDFGSSHDELAQLNVGWNPDLFGKVKRQVESATAEYEAKVEGLRDATVFINGEVALHYIAYRTLGKRLEVAREGVKNYQKIEKLISSRLEEGLTSELELHESRARLKTSAAEIPKLEQEQIVVRNRLAALLAIKPAEIKSIISKHQRIPKPPKSIMTGFPIDLLRSRPDIRRAERKVAAQSALIGVATAELYPEFSISGALTYEFLTGVNSASTLRRTLGFGPNLKWKLFQGCAAHNRIREHESKLDQAVVLYESTVIKAVTQVENSMTRLHYSGKRKRLLQEATAEHQKTAELMMNAYDVGEVDLRRLLNAQQDYLITKDESLATEGRHAAHSVRLFKALGGGELPQPAKAVKVN